MNLIFSLIFTLALIIMTVTSPNLVLSTMLSGGEKALSLTLKMSVVYAVWLGVFEIFERTGASKKLAKLLTPVNKLLFGDVTDKENEFASMNISANMLGMSGATTPFGIKTIEEMQKRTNSDYAITMFFVINATSVQIIPTSVMALRSSMNSINPASIILPTLLTTLLSSAIGILLVKIFCRRNEV